MISEIEKKRLKEILLKYSYKEEDIKLNHILENIKSYKKPSYKNYYSGFLKLGFSFTAIVLIFFIFLVWNKPQTVSINDGKKTINVGSIINTEKEKYEIVLKNKAKVTIFENSTFNILSTSERKTIFELKKGKGHFKVDKKDKTHFVVKTSSLEISIKGTEFFVFVNDGNEQVHVIEGKVSIENILSKQTTDVISNEAITLQKEGNVLKKEFTDLKLVERMMNPTEEIKKEVKIQQKKNRYTETKDNLIYLDENTVVFNKKELYIYQTGEYLNVKRKITLPDNINKITPYQNIILVNGENGGLYAYNLEGDYLWANMEAGVVKFFSKPVIKDDRIYLATVDKGIQIFSLEGRLIDVIKKGDKKAIYNSPVILSDKSIVYLNENGELTRYDVLNKRNVWQINIEDRILFPFFERDGILYLILKSRSEVVAMNVENGEKIWGTKIKENLYINNFYIFGEYLIVGSDDGIIVFNRTSGEIEKLFNYDFPIKQAITETNRLYLLDLNNRLTIWTIPDFIKVYERKFTKEIKRITYYNGKILVYGNNFYQEVTE